jgi:hypothetical protein
MAAQVLILWEQDFFERHLTKRLTFLLFFQPLLAVTVSIAQDKVTWYYVLYNFSYDNSAGIVYFNESHRM